MKLKNPRVALQLKNTKTKWACLSEVPYKRTRFKKTPNPTPKPGIYIHMKT